MTAKHIGYTLKRDQTGAETRKLQYRDHDGIDYTVVCTRDSSGRFHFNISCLTNPALKISLDVRHRLSKQARRFVEKQTGHFVKHNQMEPETGEKEFATA